MNAPAIWQRTIIEQVLHGIPGVQSFMDDIVLSGSTLNEHLERLDAVLQRVKDYGLKANMDKCKFLQEKVNYCGHTILHEGLQQSPEKNCCNS